MRIVGVGVDPTGLGGALASDGDLRSSEHLIEAGFTPRQVVQIMTLNGARILGVAHRLETAEEGR